MNDSNVSVIIPNFNHGKFLRRSLNALLQQSVLPAEIIVIDDGSTDNSLEVLHELAVQHRLIRVFSNERNRGVHWTMNRGLDLARCPYLFFTAADDEVRPGLFEHSLPLLQAHPQAGLSSGLTEWRSAADGLSWTMGTRMPSQPSYLSPVEMVQLGRQGRLLISAQTALFRKSALVEAGGWIPELRWFCDFFAAYVIGFRHGICHVPEVLANFNLNPHSYYHNVRAKHERLKTIDQLLGLLESPRYNDVASPMRESGMLGTFGWGMVKVVARRRKRWHFVNLPFTRMAGRRCAEVVARRLFPLCVARACLKVFYGRLGEASSVTENRFAGGK